MTIRPKFTKDDVKGFLDKNVEQTEAQLIRIMQRTGEKFVNDARSKRTYMDQTGNLRSSIGYIVIHNGKVVGENFEVSGRGRGTPSEKEQAKESAKRYAYSLNRNVKNAIILVGVAGMNYAKHVEDKNFDVITGSEPKPSYIQSFINEIK